MATKNDLFDPRKKDELLKTAIKKVKQRKGKESFPCVFGIGKSGTMLVLDWKRQNDPVKLFLEMKKTADKVILGEAAINGEMIEIDVKDSKGGKIKPIDVKRCLRDTSLRKCRLKTGGVVEEDDDDKAAKKTKSS